MYQQPGPRGLAYLHLGKPAAKGSVAERHLSGRLLYCCLYFADIRLLLNWRTVVISLPICRCLAGREKEVQAAQTSGPTSAEDDWKAWRDLPGVQTLQSGEPGDQAWHQDFHAQLNELQAGQV